MKRIYTVLFLLLAACVCNAQFAVSHITSIRSPQMMLNDVWDAPAVIRMGSDDVITFSFDEMSHVYHRYVCKVTHRNADWAQSELGEIDYLDGFNAFPVEWSENSENTTTLYTHYEFTIPNENLTLKCSGNYRVELYDEELSDDVPVATFDFSVVEPLMSISAEVSGDTDRSFNEGEQQLSFTVDYSRCNVQSPASEIIPVAYQNRRRDNVAIGLKPTYITGGKLEYVHNENLIFQAGNEYRRFELTDPNSPGMGVDKVIYTDTLYNALLYTDMPRRSCSNDRDENGRYFINTLEGYGSTLEADYVNVHFTLDAPYRTGGNYYLLGDLTNSCLSKENKLLYDYEECCYFTSRLLKLGVYNYMYVWVPDGSKQAVFDAVEGNFYNAENEYLIYIYYRAFGARYDRLLGVGEIKRK